jgi:hypothetical protein
MRKERHLFALLAKRRTGQFNLQLLNATAQGLMGLWLEVVSSGKDCDRTILPVVTRNNAYEPTDQLAGATWATVYRSAISWSKREGPGRPEKKIMSIDCGDFRWTKIRAVMTKAEF